MTSSDCSMPLLKRGAASEWCETKLQRCLAKGLTGLPRRLACAECR